MDELLTYKNVLEELKKRKWTISSETFREFECSFNIFCSASESSEVLSELVHPETITLTHKIVIIIEYCYFPTFQIDPLKRMI